MARMTEAIAGFELLGESARDSSAHDKAPFERGMMSVTQLERWLSEIRDQPVWRREADKCADYYDGNQLDPETLQRLADKGLGPLITNLIAPTVNAVLGMEAKARTDWTVSADDDQWADVADALSAKLHEAERESHADRANSDAYAETVKAGFSAVEISRNSNPFEYPYRVEHIHRSELYWDWRCRKPDWSDARYIVRKKRYDADHLAAWFPQHAELIKAAGNFADWADYLTLDNRIDAVNMHSMDQGLRTSWDDLEWRDTTRQQVTCFEVWYRVWNRGLVLSLPGGRVIEWCDSNPYHRAVVAAGAVQPKVAVYDSLRVAFYCGPIRLMDRATNRRRFPYIPFFGYREDLTGVPYGLIRTMVSPQDEVNARTARMMWLLNARRVLIDSDALDAEYNTLTTASREIGRADAFIITNPAAARGQIKVDDNMQLSTQQFQVMQERKQAIQEAAGVYSALMGQNSNATSGTAIQSLVEQGVTTLAEINDNYRMSRRLVGQALLELVKEDMTEQMDVLVDTGTNKRRVVVNIPAQTEAGMPCKHNDVQIAPVKVTLGDVPSTPSYRQQQFGQFAEILKSMPPQYQALLIPFALEMSDFSKRNEMAAFLREQLGINAADPDSPEAQQAQQAQAQAQQAAMQLQMEDAQSKIQERQAKAQKAMAEAAAIADPQERMEQLAQEIRRLQLQLASRQEQTEASLQQTAMHEQAETERTIMRINAGAHARLPAG